jgi:hypothetical protein
VVTETAPLVVTGPAPLKRVRDPALETGEKVLEDSGEPARATSVRRLVYAPDGTLLRDDTWKSSYRGEPRIVRVGTKPKPKPKRPPKPPPGPAQPPAERAGGVGISP